MTQRPALRLWLFIAVVGAFVADAATAEAGGRRGARLSRDSRRPRFRQTSGHHQRHPDGHRDRPASHRSQARCADQEGAARCGGAGVVGGPARGPQSGSGDRSLIGRRPGQPHHDGHRPVDRRRSGVAQPIPDRTRLRRPGYRRRRHRFRCRPAPVVARPDHRELRLHAGAGVSRSLRPRHARRQHHCRP